MGEHEELINYFKRIDLPETRMELNHYETATNVKLFVEGCLNRLQSPNSSIQKDAVRSLTELRNKLQQQ
ncbi:DUF6965 family protein [Arsenicibacter rosenii]|uniref:DUF6965 domain-containing protein n=1 Tax=Arsenicibacter rosenii TaxID=1750698 RepID=A0A1S2VIZ5_9BACT|nr:hypothetical protein [Arsenicibacter rosenii]OIN58731.1 hypothetical protein BLX24_14350 [Arsenicibacter rosenii]